MPWETRARGIRGWPPRATTISEPSVEHTLKRLAPDARIADVGAGGRRIKPGTVPVDLLAGPDIDVSCDIHSIPLPASSFDCVFCTGTLQYVQDPARVLSEIHRILKPGRLGSTLAHASRFLFRPFLVLDRVWRHHRQAPIIASGVYVVGRRR